MHIHVHAHACLQIDPQPEEADYQHITGAYQLEI